MNVLSSALVIIFSLVLVVATFTTVMKWGNENETAAHPPSHPGSQREPSITASIRVGVASGGAHQEQAQQRPDEGLEEKQARVELARAFKIANGREPASPGEVAASLKLLDEAGQTGNAKALQVYADALHKGELIEGDPLRAIDYYDRSLALGNAGAGIALGFILARGNGVAKDTVRAIAYLERSIELSDSSAALKLLGDLYLERDHPHFDTAKGYYVRALKQGNEGAAVALGSLAIGGEASERDFAEAERYFREALALGSTKALKLLADTYYARDNPLRDVSRAVEYYRDATLIGDDSASISLARMYTLGELPGERREDVADLLSRFADGPRRRDVAKLLGDVFSLAGPGRDMQRAVQNYERAGMLGDGWAFLALGDLARREEPEAVKLGRAAAHYQKAADHGVARAYVRLGDLASSGGAARADSNALLYYSLAEGAGDAIGSLRLARAQQGSFDHLENIKNAATRYKLALKEVGSAETIRHLRSGDKRGLVGIVQYLLDSTGYDIGPIDGVVGSKTVSALGQFCAEHALAECTAEVEDAPLETLLRISTIGEDTGEPEVVLQ